MKLLMFFLITILTGGVASMAQEAPEPIAPEFTYTFQMCWGTTSIPTPLWVDVNYPRINAEASCFNEGLLSDTEGLPSPQALGLGYTSPTEC
jgi:hypothetical protein